MKILTWPVGCRCCTWYRCSTSNLQWQSRQYGLLRSLFLARHSGRTRSASRHTVTIFTPRTYRFGIGRILPWHFADFASSLGGGCPGKKLVNIGEGNNDAALFVLGMVLGATAAHNFALAASPAGVTQFTPYVFVIGFVVCLYIGLTNKSKI
ncbi:hypothetical protein CF65_02772 [Aggregatibacter actinomycetemcomitans HK1651]|nr:hypothetical protein CF65_02772 [Aggregatibacter actinomycetemcomitans HK1651]